MSSGAVSTAPSGTQGGGAFGLHPRGRLAVAAALLVVLAVVVGLLVGSGGSSPSGATAARNAKYGGYPTWLTHTKLPSTNAVLQSSAAHPQVEAIEGNTIAVHLAGSGLADITTVGPAFPAGVSPASQAGTLPEGAPVPASFTVTVIAEHGAVPVRASAFSILTAAGQLVHPAVTNAGGGPVPATLAAGQHVNLTLSVKLAEGDGSVRWAPAGAQVLAGWLYQLELD